MLQSQRIVRELKAALKQRQVSYAQVARCMDLSESSVKRLFSQGGFTLERLEAVCELADIDLMELARRAENTRQQLSALSEQQEREVVADPVLLLVAICALNRWRFEDIQQTYAFTEAQLVGHLIRLDRLGLLELLPGNRIKLRIARNFAWLPNGPIHKYFATHLQHEFLTADFDSERDVYRFAWGLLSAESTHALREKINELVDAFDTRSRADEVRSAGSHTGTCMLVAFREWEPRSFELMRRDKV